MNKIYWKHVLIALGLIYLFVHLPTILYSLSSLLSSSFGAIDHVLKGISHPSRYRYTRGNDVQDLIKLCVVLIGIVAVVKIISRSK